LMDCLVFLERRDTGGTQEARGLWVRLVRMDREERMERSGQGDWLARAVLEVSWVRAVHPGPPDNLVSPVWTAHTVPKETWGRRESPAHPGSRESPERRVFLVLKAPSDHLVRRGLGAGQGWPACLDPMDLLVILVRRVHPERKEP